MKTNVIPAQPASAFGAPPSGDPGLVNAELRTASRPRYPALKFALLSLLAALCFAAPRAHASGGTVIGWGYNRSGQVNIPADLSDVTAIAAGYSHSLALKSDGTVVGWGDNSWGQVNIPADLSGVTAIAAGGYHSLALKLPNRAPVARCKNVTVSSGADCAATVTPAQVNDGSSDPDTGDAINLSLDTTGPFGLGFHTVTLTATDLQGESSSCTATVTVVDDTPPVLGPCPANQTVTASSTAGAVATFATPGATDNCSVSVNCAPASGSTFPLGTTTVIGTATDGSGNSAQCSFNVNVVYSWSGVLQPINADGSSVFKLGTTVQVKFQLTGASAGIANAVAKLSYTKLPISIPPSPVNEATSTAAATSGNLFRYDAKTKQYVFNWGTKGLTAGLYQLKIDLGDG